MSDSTEATKTKNIDNNEVMAPAVDNASSLCKVRFDGNDVLHVMLISVGGRSIMVGVCQ